MSDRETITRRLDNGALIGVSELVKASGGIDDEGLLRTIRTDPTGGVMVDQSVRDQLDRIEALLLRLLP